MGSLTHIIREYIRYLEAVYKNQVDIILDSSNPSLEKMPFIDLDCFFVSCVKQLKRNKAAGDHDLTNEE